MKSFFLSPQNVLLNFLAILLLTMLSLNVTAQANPNCPDNPDFPGCLPPGSADVFKVLLVLDESGSMIGNTAQVRNTINDFATTLHNNATSTGEFELGIVEFSTSASVGLTMTDVRASNFLSQVSTYANTQYNPSGVTNYAAALNTVVANFTDLDIVFFISDGDPHYGGGGTTIANQIKCDGTYIFGIALGSDIVLSNIIGISGPDELDNPLSLAEGADWLQRDITGLADALVALANSLVDTEAPVVSCPLDIVQVNDDRACGARVFYNVTATDNCTANPAISSSPASGSLFAVGTTTVSSTATDDAGHSSTCTFTVMVRDVEQPEINCGPAIIVNNDIGSCGAVINLPTTATDNCTANPVISCTPASGSMFPVGTSLVNCSATDEAGNSDICINTVIVLDREAPQITCPPNVTVEVGNATDPSSTGTPITTDNCAVDQVIHTDKTLPGTCLGESTINRRWDVFDASGNENTCVQFIQIIDTTPPVISTPANAEVVCDTSTAATGVATATDAGDPTPVVSYRDTVASGHCDYKCTIHRIWTAIDDCNNKSNSVQVIEKDITSLVETAIRFNGEDALFLGLPESRNPTSFRVKAEEADCVVQWLPDTKGRPTALKGGFQGVEGRRDDPTSCKPGSNPYDPATGRLSNPIFAEALKLSLYLRLHPEFNDVLLESFGCEIDYVTFTGLGPSGNIRSFMDAANKALGNQNMTPHERSWLKAFRCINGSYDLCD
jgi:hypothetical protein